MGVLEEMLLGHEIENSYESSGIYYVSEPAECILVDPSKLRAFRKVPEITTSLIVNDIKLLELNYFGYQKYQF